ncbi:MAG TPA: hypothetical protein VGQ93_09485 [Lysobacter sp.]|jgi:hypothetical protein|nr:hypothetical protein [Lysobacter sp.]
MTWNIRKSEKETEGRERVVLLLLVIPAQAGIHVDLLLSLQLILVHLEPRCLQNQDGSQLALG